MESQRFSQLSKHTHTHFIQLFSPGNTALLISNIMLYTFCHLRGFSCKNHRNLWHFEWNEPCREGRVWIMNPPSRSSTHGPQGHITDLIVQISHKQAWKPGKRRAPKSTPPSSLIRSHSDTPPPGPGTRWTRPLPHVPPSVKYALRRRSPAVTPRSLPAPPGGYFALGVLRRGALRPTDYPVTLASGSFSVSLVADCAWVAPSEEESSVGRRGGDYADLARAREGRWVAVGVGLRKALKAWTARAPPRESARPLEAVDAWTAGLGGRWFYPSFRVSAIVRLREVCVRFVWRRHRVSVLSVNVDYTELFVPAAASRLLSNMYVSQRMWTLLGNLFLSPARHLPARKYLPAAEIGILKSRIVPEARVLREATL